MREIGIDGVDRELDGGGIKFAGDEHADIAARIAYENDLLGGGEKLGEFVFDWLGRELVAGIEHEQVLNAADDAPVAAAVDFALIAGVEPAVANDFCGFLWAIPVAGKNDWGRER